MSIALYDAKNSSSDHSYLKNASVWRYMNLFEFTQIVVNSKLTLKQVSKFADEWDGVLSPGYIRNKMRLEIAMARDSSTPVMENFDSLCAKEKLNTDCSYVSCWTYNSPDSMLMWDSFTSNPFSCAIEITIEELPNLILEEVNYGLVSEVFYFDPNNEDGCTLNHERELFRKRVGYEHEREVRLYVNGLHQNIGLKWGSYNLNPDSLILSINPSKLESVTFHPRISESSESTVKKLIGIFDHEIPVRPSILASKPPLSI